MQRGVVFLSLFSCFSIWWVKALLSVAGLVSARSQQLRWDRDFSVLAFPTNLALHFGSSGRQKKLLPGGGQAASLLLLALTNLPNSAG